MPDIIGLVGILLCFAGAHLLWLARHEVLYWMDTYLLLFRRSFDSARREQPVTPLQNSDSEQLRAAHGLQPRPRERSEMWLMLGGFALVGIGAAATALVLMTVVWRHFAS